MRKAIRFLVVFLLITAWMFSGWPRIWQKPLVPPKIQEAKAAAVNMLLFWDGGSPPSGWVATTTFDGNFPRGESAANFWTTGGNLTHAPTVSSITNNTPAGYTATGSTADSAYTHTHTSLSVTVGSASNIPATKGYTLIQYSGGIPVNIPAGAIALFDTSVPSGWTRQSGYDGYMVQASSTVGTAIGSDTHQHALTSWSTLAAASQTSTGNTANSGATSGHTHSGPANSASDVTSSMTALPPYINVVIGKANSTTASSTEGMIAMFDADPGSAWTIKSNSGGDFYQKLIRGASTYSASPSPAGATTHDHSSVTSANSSGQASNKQKGSGTGGTAISGPTHVHTLTANFSTGTDNMPPWFNVVYAKKNASVAPNTPTQDSPANDATGVSVTPTFTMTATDADPDNISYKVTIYSNSGCTTIVGSAHDQSTDATGWTGTNATCTANPTACYSSGTQGSFALQAGDALSYSTQYWWKAAAKDPDGNRSFTNSSTCNTFTTVSATTLTFSASHNNFPALTPGVPVTATTTLSVDTNSSTGWNVTMSGDNVTLTAQTMNNGGGTEITDKDPEWIIPSSAATTTVGNAASITSGQDFLAFRIMSASGTPAFLSTAWWGTSDAMFNGSQLWAGIPSSTNASRIGKSSVSSGGAAALNTVQYYLDAPITQPMGSYSGGITFTATVNP